MNLKRKTQSGFTMIEIMVVVVIVAILAVIALPTYLDYVKSSYASEAILLSPLSTLQIHLIKLEIYKQIGMELMNFSALKKFNLKVSFMNCQNFYPQDEI